VAEGSRHLQGSLGVQGQVLQNAPSLGENAMGFTKKMISVAIENGHL